MKTEAINIIMLPVTVIIDAVENMNIEKGSMIVRSILIEAETAISRDMKIRSLSRLKKIMILALGMTFLTCIFASMV